MYEATKEFVEKEVLGNIDKIEKQEGTIVPDTLKLAGELGLLGISTPEELGGLGMSFNTSMLIADIIGVAGSFGTTFGAHTGIGTLPILYYGNEEQKQKLKETLWDEEGHLNTAIVAQPAEKIADMANIEIPEGIGFYIVPETGWGEKFPFSGEKLSVIMALYRANDIEHAIELTNNIQAYQGQGHSCGIYSNSDENIMKLANSTKTSRVMVNQPQAASNSGNLWNGMRQTFSLGCGSWGGNGTNNNISWRDLINETWVSKPLSQTKELISDEELFGDVMDKLN